MGGGGVAPLQVVSAKYEEWMKMTTENVSPLRCCFFRFLDPRQLTMRVTLLLSLWGWIENQRYEYVEPCSD